MTISLVFSGLLERCAYVLSLNTGSSSDRNSRRRLRVLEGEHPTGMCSEFELSFNELLTFR